MPNTLEALLGAAFTAAPAVPSPQEAAKAKLRMAVG